MKRVAEIKKKMLVTEINYVVKIDEEEEERVLYIPGKVKDIGGMYTLVHDAEGGTEFILKSTFSGLAMCTLNLNEFLENAEINFIDETQEETEE